MLYKRRCTLNGISGNNSLSYHERKNLLGTNPTLTIPALQDGNFSDLKMGEYIVFEEVENGVLKSCRGLESFIRLKEQNKELPNPPHITIFDNHNHALYFWIEAIHTGILTPGFELIHIDEHSDLWPNTNELDQERALENLEYAWEFTNLSCNVGNYIEPAIRSGLISQMIRIENEYQVDDNLNYTPPQNSVLNIDLDFFAPEMNFIDDAKKLTLIKNLLPKVACVTIATSPFFIDQKRAIEALHQIFQS